MVQWFLHQMRLVLPAFMQGTAGISLLQGHSLLALRKGSKLDQLLFGAKGVDCESQTFAIEEGSEEKDIGDVLTVLGAEGKK